MRIYLSFIFCFSFLFFAKAQSEEELKIRKSIDTVFEAMQSADSVLLKSVLSPDCSLRTVGIGKETVKYQNDKIEDFIKSIGTPRPTMKLEERLLDYKINIDDALAVAWTPYEFYVNDKLSHFGTNVFTLVKIDNNWKIVSIIDTRKKK